MEEWNRGEVGWDGAGQDERNQVRPHDSKERSEGGAKQPFQGDFSNLNLKIDDRDA